MADEESLYEQSRCSERSFYSTTDNDPDLRASSGSPSSAFPDDMFEKPDVSVLCKLCGVHVNLRVLGDHRRYHKALDAMRYTGKARPTSTTKLMQRRRAIIRKLSVPSSTTDKLVDSDIIHGINDAYEFLKADLEETYETLRKVKDVARMDVTGTAVSSNVGCVLGVGVCSDTNSRWKSVMEDANVFQDCLGGDSSKAFVGLYDGHHGPNAARHAAEEFHHALLYELAKFDPDVKWTESMANKAHAEVIDGGRTFEWGGVGDGQEDPGIEQDGGVCTIYQVIKSYEQRLERLQKQEKAKVAENKGKEKEGTRKEMDKSSETITETGIRCEQDGAKTEGKRSRKKKYRNAYSEMVENALKRAYKHTDLLLSWGEQEHSCARWSGCSAFTAMIEGAKDALKRDEPSIMLTGQQDDTQQENVKLEPKELGRIHLAQAGNVNCVLIRGNQIYRMTKEHTPKNPRERSRIEKTGGSVTDSNRDVRVNGLVSATRGLGNHGDELMRACVPNVPYTTVVPVDEHAQLLLIASHGVWEVFSVEEAAHILREMLPCNQLPPPSRLGMSIQCLLAANGRPDTATSRHHTDRVKHVGPSPAPSQERRVFGNINNDGNLPATAIQTEVNSGGDLSDESESGNEANIDTHGDTVADVTSQRSTVVPCQDEIRREFAKVLSELLVQAAMMAGSRDNVTAMVVLLPACGL